MRLLFIARKYPPSVGGMQLFAHNLYGALSNTVDTKLIKWGGSNLALPLVLPYLLWRAFWELCKGRTDVIHMQDGVLAPIGYVLSKLFRKPYGVVIHGLDITYNNVIYRVFFVPAIRRANVVFCISQAAADAAQARGVAKAKIHVIPLAVDDTLYATANRPQLVEQLQLPPNSQLLLTVGRLVKRKGVAWFIDNVLPDLVQKHPNLTYLVVGEGNDRSNIKAAITKNDLSSSVRLLGKVDDALYKAAYNGADVFIMPNISVPGDMEGFGLVLLEAATCALPVVAANIEGIKDAIQDGKNGVLVPVKDRSAFVENIAKFLDDKQYAHSFGAQSRDFTLATYRWDALADRYLAEYRQLSR